MKTLYCKISLFVFFVVFSFKSIAQSDSLYIDSLKKVLLTAKEDTNKVSTLISLTGMYTFINLDSAIILSKEAEICHED